MSEPLAPENHGTSRAFLKARLEEAARLPSDMPTQADHLLGWMEEAALATGEHYAQYLDSRKAGEPRRYFSSRSHALSFLQQVAPTKLVDGAWLYGVLQYWRDDRFHPLIRTYLEELGDGDPAQNHVVLYQRLLTAYGADDLPDLGDEHYLQGALQLAMGYHADEFLPELIGYNLGYEQLPLHLLITAFELDELAIDPYYFTLHVTIDNASTGHARKAVQALLATMPATGDPGAFLERVSRGYRLNDLGLKVSDIIEHFDLEQALVAMLERKSIFGRHLHSDFCSIGGKTVNEWLMRSGQMSGFLQALVDNHWVKRNEDPRQSRFWRLIDGNEAPMFGVFSACEKQLIFDWIAGNWLSHGENVHSPSDAEADRRSHTIRRRSAPGRPERIQVSKRSGPKGDLDQDVSELARELALLPEELRMQRLIRLMAPSSHATAAGLLATRLFSAVLP
ncbi:iron-containing redox enzyme family protein [Allohahella marinimesophila]|uniref:Iron-containing redox enzyme family protein n=1 Tax=Allohahella marinimesophila TaxID=1054972 RepID=A0ABP7Q2K6_9GAMM